MDLFESGVATVTSERGRLALPQDVVRVWKLGAEIGDEVLVVEIVAAGHLRLFRTAMAQNRVGIEQKTAEQYASNPQELEERVRTHRDRFRSASFNKSDKNRVALSQELVLALIGQSRKEKVYVEVGQSWIDVMTNDVRFRRLQVLTEE
jgi:hypothetical protein